jgi:hypothetical protein
MLNTPPPTPPRNAKEHSYLKGEPVKYRKSLDDREYYMCIFISVMAVAYWAYIALGYSNGTF